MSDIQPTSSPIPTSTTPPVSTSAQVAHTMDSLRKMPVAARQSLINLSLGMGIMLVALSGGAYLMMTNKEVLLGGKASVDKQSSFSFAAPTEVKPGEQFTVDVILDTSADPEYAISGADALIQYSFTPDYKEYINTIPVTKGKGEELMRADAIREVQDGSSRGFEVGSGGAGISWEEQQRMNPKPMGYSQFTLVKTEYGTIFDSYPATPSSFEAPIPGIPPPPKPVPQIVCGGIRGTTCPNDMYCQYNAGAEIDRFYPDGNTRPIADQTGVCVISTKPTPPSSIMCGGIAGLMCPSGFTCQIDSAMRNIPDASGSCVPATLNEKPVSDDNRVLGATTAKSKKLAMTVEPINYLPIEKSPAEPPEFMPPVGEKSPAEPPEFMPPVKTIQGTTSISGIKNYAVDDQGYFKGFTGKGVFARLTFVANTTGKIELKFAYSGETATDDSNINGFIKNVPVNIQKSSERLLTAPASLQVMIAKPVVVLPSPTASASGTPVPYVGLACNERCDGEVGPPVKVPPCGELSNQISNHTLSLNQNNDIYSNWGGLNEKWFVNEKSGSDRWYYMYKDGDSARVMSWSSGSGLAQGGANVRDDAQVATVSLQCYDLLQPGFKFPAPDPANILRGTAVSESFRYDPKSCAPGLACVSGICRNTSCSDSISCQCDGSTSPPENRPCDTNAQCSKGYECFKPPIRDVCIMSEKGVQICPSSPQMAPYCRQIVLPSGTPSPTSTPRPANHVSWKTGAALLEADDFEISINRNGTVKKYYARSGDLTVHSDMNPQNPTLELNWTENDVPMRLYVYFENTATSWRVNQIKTYDGSAAGQWLVYKNYDIKSLYSDVFISPRFVATSVNMVSQESNIPVGSVTFLNMRLQNLLSLKPSPTPIPDKPVINIALSLQGRSNHATKALVYQVNTIGESLLGQVQTDSDGNGSIQWNDPSLGYDPNLKFFVEVPGFLRKYSQSIVRSSANQVTDGFFKPGMIFATFGMMTAGDLSVGASGFGDHQVNSVDIAEMYTQWSSATEPGLNTNTNLSGDLNGDGVVNNRDYAIIMMNFGKKVGVLK